ncbi:unnamed protein product [Ilex paraguariensis]|uniref:Uncharacterized protein n=1 Tax=Ilex paraguariensis TaxID=185542 RepID=A0ABC8UCZ7_9AQUA
MEFVLIVGCCAWLLAADRLFSRYGYVTPDDVPELLDHWIFSWPHVGFLFTVHETVHVNNLVATSANAGGFFSDVGFIRFCSAGFVCSVAAQLFFFCSQLDFHLFFFVPCCWPSCCFLVCFDGGIFGFAQLDSQLAVNGFQLGFQLVFSWFLCLQLIHPFGFWFQLGAFFCWVFLLVLLRFLADPLVPFS